MIANARLHRDVDKCAVPGVLKQPALADARHENVREPVVVVIANGDAHAIHLDIQPRRPRHIRKRSVTIVVIQAHGATVALVPRPVHAVDDENVLPAVVVVIEKSTTGPQRFGQILAAECAAVVTIGDAGLRRDIHQAKAGSGRRCSPQQRRGRCAQQKFPAIHGSCTSPLRTAYKTSSAVR
jgi:hypothetical protein